MLLLEAFITYHATSFSKSLTSCIRSKRFSKYFLVDIVLEASKTDLKARDTLIEIRDLSVTKSTIDYTEGIDRLTSLCCMILGDTPPAPQVRFLGGGVSSGNEYNSGNTRRGSMLSGRSGGQHYNYGLQLDIERMFSRKIKVFDIENFQLTTECIVSTVLKVWIPPTVSSFPSPPIILSSSTRHP